MAMHRISLHGASESRPLIMEAKYVALSMAMQEQLPLINRQKEIVAHNVDASL